MKLTEEYLSNNDLDTEKGIKWENLVGMLNLETSTYFLDIPEEEAVKYDGDFYGLLIHKCGIEPKYLYPTTLVNGYNSPNEYTRDYRRIRLLKSEALKKMLLSINKKT